MLYQEPLVSIVVVTYNSSRFVLETLESAKEQTYQNLELIVTDDCSTDNTVEICRNWIEKNSTRFVNTELITTEKNTGIAPNANRGLKKCRGEWIKFIAGDDKLTDNCIHELILHLNNNKNLPITFLVHGIIPFKNGTEFTVVYPPKKLMQNDAHKQLIHLLKRGNSISGSTFFLERSTLLKLDGFDERYKLYEDFPLILKYTKNNYKIWLIKKPLVKYRIHSTNLSFENSFLIKDSYVKFKNEIFNPLLLEHKLYLTFWHRFIQEKHKFKILRMFLLVLSPVGWVNKIYKILGKSYFYNHQIEFQKKKCNN